MAGEVSASAILANSAGILCARLNSILAAGHVLDFTSRSIAEMFFPSDFSLLMMSDCMFNGTSPNFWVITAGFEIRSITSAAIFCLSIPNIPGFVIIL